MVQTKIMSELNNLLREKKYKYFVDGDLNKARVIEDLHNYEPELIKLLNESEVVKKHFLIEINGTKILKINELIEIFEMNEYWDDSYTAYENKIGLTFNDKFLSNTTEVVLDFPYKDTVLKASMSKEEKEKEDLLPEEPFLNEKIAREEIDILFDNKILVNAAKYDEEDIQKVDEFSRNDNLLIKGNNLLALHSIKDIYSKSFDVIYIDPPYNVTSSNNTFIYNNNFNHSSWLVFMKNRLEIAKDLLREEDGVLIIAIDENEVNYLGVLLDEIFDHNYEKHLITVVHNPRGVQGTNFSYSNDFMYFVFPRGKKLIENRILLDGEIEFSNLRNWGGESLRTDGRNTFYPIIVDTLTDEIVGFGDITDEDIHPKQTEIRGNKAYVYPIDTKGVERKWRYARNTVDSIKDMLKAVKKNDSSYEIMLGKNFGQYKTVWQSPLYDASVHGKQLLKQLVPDTEFTFPKSVYTVYDALYAVVQNRKNAKILDFFSGSGTTAHAVQMLNRNDDGNRTYVMIEQMPYIKTTQIPRLLAKDEKKKNDPFIYVELMEKNTGYLKDVLNAESIDRLREVFNLMLANADFDFRIDLEEVEESIWRLPLEEQKRILVKIIDKNQLYYNYSEIDDENVRELISDSDYAFNKSFYDNSGDKDE